MSKRCREKRITAGSRALKFLRKQAGLSMQSAADASGLGFSVINPLENGRIAIRERHLEKLLQAYNATFQTYEMFSSGSVPLPKDIRSECLELVLKMSSHQLQTAYQVLASLAAQDRGESYV